jgi:orotidine-5'-phosphate decarboxylase
MRTTDDAAESLGGLVALAWEVHMYGVVDEADFECLLPGIGCLVTQARRILAPLLFPA